MFTLGFGTNFFPLPLTTLGFAGTATWDLDFPNFTMSAQDTRAESKAEKKTLFQWQTKRLVKYL